uniref:Uncharacterized protein n=1 Tax=Glossina palpalis gambiensis TaxID=67801 RepID=A0A1B0BGC3_9MUSC
MLEKPEDLNKLYRLSTKRTLRKRANQAKATSMTATTKTARLKLLPLALLLLTTSLLFLVLYDYYITISSTILLVLLQSQGQAISTTITERIVTLEVLSQVRLLILTSLLFMLIYYYYITVAAAMFELHLPQLAATMNSSINSGRHQP